MKLICYQCMLQVTEKASKHKHNLLTLNRVGNISYGCFETDWISY